MDAQRLFDPRLTHGIVFISDTFTESDFNTVTALYRDYPTTMFVKLLAGGAVKVSSRTLYRKPSVRKGKRARSDPPKAKAGGKQRAVACPRTGVVLHPSNKMLQVCVWGGVVIVVMVAVVVYVCMCVCVCVCVCLVHGRRNCVAYDGTTPCRAGGPTSPSANRSKALPWSI